MKVAACILKENVENFVKRFYFDEETSITSINEPWIAIDIFNFSYPEVNNVTSINNTNNSIKRALELRTEFNNLPMVILDRELCETDNTYLQLIPYVTIVNDDNEILMYSRGVKGNEERLHDLYSIGFGGHIETIQNDSVYESIIDTIKKELMEEINFEVHLTALEFINGAFALIYDPRNEVSSVHLGVWYVLKVNKDLHLDPEKQVIEKIQWINLEKLNEDIVEGKIELENWSIHAISIINKFGINSVHD